MTTKQESSSSLTSQTSLIAEALPSEFYVEHQVAPLRQQHSWDCGVTCVLMLLDGAARAQALRDLDRICAEEGFGHSTWTIDLCYLLKRFNIDHCMYTINIGVNEEFRKQKYYNKIIDQDRARVVARFGGAGGAGVRVRAARLGPAALVRHVSRAGPALLLVDGSVLRCSRCRPLRLSPARPRAYAGHYVLVTGAARGRLLHLLYRDPARACRTPAPCRAPAARLERARRAPGTDEDVVLIFRDRRRAHADLADALAATAIG